MRSLPGRLVLLGHPVAHSLSPVFQNAALRHAGIALPYEPLDVPPARLAAVLSELVAGRVAGNVTLPHKSAVAAMCASLTGAAELTGAVNTFWTEGGALVGDNTDVGGFRALVRRVMGEVPDGATVGLVGAGGGAAAVCAAVAEWPGARVRCFNRSSARALSLAARFPHLVTAVDTAEDAVRDAVVVINATPMGLSDEVMPVGVEHLRRDAAVMDLAYRRGETAWVRAARGAGHPAADGLEMLLAQGAYAFERWFGQAPDLQIMRAALAA